MDNRTMPEPQARMLDDLKVSETRSEHEQPLHLRVPAVAWYKDPGLRKLYAMMPIFFLGSTLTGYDGSLLNGLQTMEPWRECEFLAFQLQLQPNANLSGRLWRSFRLSARRPHSYSKHRWLLCHLLLFLCRRYLRTEKGSGTWSSLRLPWDNLAMRSIHRLRHVSRRALLRRLRVEFCPRFRALTHYRVGPPKASRSIDNYVQHALVPGLHNCSMDCVRYGQLHWQLIVAHTCSATSDDATDAVRADMGGA